MMETSEQVEFVPGLGLFALGALDLPEPVMEEVEPEPVEEPHE